MHGAFFRAQIIEICSLFKDSSPHLRHTFIKLMGIKCLKPIYKHIRSTLLCCRRPQVIVLKRAKITSFRIKYAALEYSLLLHRRPAARHPHVHNEMSCSTSSFYFTLHPYRLEESQRVLIKGTVLKSHNLYSC